MQSINQFLTLSIARLYPSKYRNLTFWLGIVPFEIYKGGIFIALIQMIWLSSFNGIQFHVLPFFIANTIIGMLKDKYDSPRPGCVDPIEFPHTNPNYCMEPTRNESFPSGHSGVAFALLAGIYMQLFHGNGKIFEILIPSGNSRLIFFGIAAVVAFIVALHRIIGGYHTVWDVIFGGALGFSFGVFSWIAGESVKSNAINVSQIFTNNTTTMLIFKGIWTLVILDIAYSHLEELKDLKEMHH